MKLFRTDGGLAGVLREVHMLRLLKEENNLELARVESHNTVIMDEKNNGMHLTTVIIAQLCMQCSEECANCQVVYIHTEQQVTLSPSTLQLL